MDYQSNKTEPLRSQQPAGEALIRFDQKGNLRDVSIIASSEAGERIVKAALHRRNLLRVPPNSQPFKLIQGGQS